MSRSLLGQAVSRANGRLARGALQSVAIVGVGTILGYAVQILISRTLGPAEFGTYVYVLGWVGFARLVATLSYDLAAVRYVGIYFTDHDWGRIKGFLRTSRRVMAVVSLHIVIGCALAVLVFRDRMPPHLPSALLAGCLLLAPTAYLSLESSALQGLRLVFAARLPFSIVRPTVLAGALFIATHSYGYDGNAVLALFANVVGTLVALLISFTVMQRRIPSGTAAIATLEDRRSWNVFCAANLGQSLLYMLLSQQSDVILVGSLVSTTDAGYYSAAGQIASVLTLAVASVNQYVAPMLAAHTADATDRNLPAVLSRALVINIAMTVPIFIMIVLLGPWMLKLFGPTFSVAYPVVLILAVSHLFGSLWGGLWGDLLTMRGLYRESTLVVVMATTLNLILMAVLAPRFGIVGAATATTTAIIFRCLLVAFLVHRHFRFWPWTVWRHAFLQ